MCKKFFGLLALMVGIVSVNAQSYQVALSIQNSPNENGQVVVIAGTPIGVGFTVVDPQNQLSSKDLIQLVKNATNTVTAKKERGNDLSGSILLNNNGSQGNPDLGEYCVQYVHNGTIIAKVPLDDQLQIMLVPDEVTAGIMQRVNKLENQGIINITSVDNNDGTITVTFHKIDGSIFSITTPNLRGPQGHQGPAGLTGAQGIPGEKGEQGIQGPIGLTGPQGLQGDKGEKGDKGDPGIQGVAGANGDKGDKGDQGDIGLQGPPGTSGTDYNGMTCPEGQCVAGFNQNGLICRTCSSDPTLPKPIAPANVLAAAGNGQIALTWTSSPGATMYMVYWSELPGVTKYSYSYITTSNNFMHNGLTNGVVYFYKIAAKNGSGESDLSLEVSATPRIAVPARPQNVGAQGGDAQVLIVWSAVTDATKYTLYWATTPNVTTSSNKIENIYGTSFSHVGLTNETRYYYKVSASNATGESGLSAEVNVVPSNVGIILWQKSLGGTKNEECFSLEITNDGGCIVAGRTESSNGDVTLNKGASDYWVVKLDGNGEKEWQKTYGGTDIDKGYDIVKTSDGGYIIVGESESNNGDVSGNHGMSDYWVVKINGSGDISWQKCYGGSSWDRPRSVKQTPDGGYVIAGQTFSTDGDVAGKFGTSAYPDFWIIKIDAIGNLEWQKCIGSVNTDAAIQIQLTTDGGYVVGGYTDRLIGGNNGNYTYDFFIVKLQSNGEIEWEKNFGGENTEYAYTIRQTADGGFIAGGSTRSFSRDVSGNHGESDIWAVKLSSTGTIEWQKCLGGTGDETAFDINQTQDNGYFLVGQSTSINGDVSRSGGAGGGWVVKLTSNGILEWEQSLGVGAQEIIRAFKIASDGSFIVVGQASAVIGNHGLNDFWVVKFKEQE